MLIVGSQRSGTKSASLVFDIKHEVQFTPYIDHNTAPPIHSLRSEASWLAQPFLKNYPRTAIIHIVRNPLDVINSIVGIEFFDLTSHFASGHKPYRDFALKFTNIKSGLTELETTIHYYLQWTAPLDDYPRIRIEDIKGAPRANSRDKEEHDYDSIKNEVPIDLYHKLLEKVAYYGDSYD